MNTKDISVVSFHRPPVELVKAALPSLRLGAWSLLTYYTNKYLQIKTGNFYSSFIFYKNKIVGWGIITPNYAAHSKTCSYRELFIKGRYLLMLYVSKAYRRLKIGKLIVKSLLKLIPDKSVSVIGHNESSWRFFNKMRHIAPNKINIIDWR